MAGKFKYIKKAIVTITKGPRKGKKELRYFYKGDKIPKSLKSAGAATKTVKGSFSPTRVRSRLRGIDWPDSVIDGLMSGLPKGQRVTAQQIRRAFKSQGWGGIRADEGMRAITKGAKAVALK